MRPKTRHSGTNGRIPAGFESAITAHLVVREPEVRPEIALRLARDEQRVPGRFDQVQRELRANTARCRYVHESLEQVARVVAA